MEERKEKRGKKKRAINSLWYVAIPVHSCLLSKRHQQKKTKSNIIDENWNLIKQKTILRWKMTKLNENRIKYIFLPIFK